VVSDMIVSTDLAHAVFKKVKYIREEYRRTVLNGDANVISVESLQRVIEGMYRFKIQKSLVPFEGEFIRGMMERWHDRLQIWVRANQSPDWLRFTATKEMCHGVIDEEEDWSVKGVGTLEDILVEYRLVEGEAAARATQSEIFAELAAIELLYPFECREADIQALARNETTLVKIAGYHGIPTAMVGRALSPSHHEFASRFWAAQAE
jgi:Zn-dependent peptidase ImmA (M78 family)